MNSRIRELYEEAKSFYLTDEYILPPSEEDCELIGQKFAELIIKEVFAKIEDERFEVYAPVVESVKKYFGVGEQTWD